MLSKSLIQFSVEGLGCVPSLLFDLRPNYGGGNEDNYLSDSTELNWMKIIATSFERTHCGHCYTQCLQHCSRPPPTHASAETPGHSQASLGQSFVGSLLLPPGSSCPQDFVCALQESVSPVLCKFLWSSGGVNGNLFQEGLCLTQVCCTQSPCSNPLLTHTSSGDTQTQSCLSLCGVSGSWCTQGVFESSEHLWWIWCLIPNVILPLLQSFWGFSFALGYAVSLQSCSNTADFTSH